MIKLNMNVPDDVQNVESFKEAVDLYSDIVSSMSELKNRLEKCTSSMTKAQATDIASYALNVYHYVLPKMLPLRSLSRYFIYADGDPYNPKNIKSNKLNCMSIVDNISKLTDITFRISEVSMDYYGVGFNRVKDLYDRYIDLYDICDGSLQSLKNIEL